MEVVKWIAKPDKEQYLKNVLYMAYSIEISCPERRKLRTILTQPMFTNVATLTLC